MNKKLEIFYKNTFAGILEKSVEGQFIFEYDDDYLASSRPSLSLSLPKEDKHFESDHLFAFFDGLIPEGWVLNLASKKLRLNPMSERFELLEALCQDCIGAVHVGSTLKRGESVFSLKRTRESKRKNYGRCLICYEDCDDVYHSSCMKKVFGQEIYPAVDFKKSQLEDWATQRINKKIAVAGVQRKLSLDIQNDIQGKASRLTVTNLWGRFILKPKGAPPHLPENEHLILKLAEKLGIVVAQSALIPTADGDLAFISRRFDRGESEEEFHQEDFCQILGKLSLSKYTGSLEQIGKVLKSKSDFPGDNLYRLYELTMFNFLVGNVDGHLKNFSLSYEGPQGLKKLLSPAYDLLSTDLYIDDDDEEVALALNGKKNKLKRDDFIVLAKYLNLSEKVHDRIMKKVDQCLKDWDLLIKKSFLLENDKRKLQTIIRSRYKRLCAV